MKEKVLIVSTGGMDKSGGPSVLMEIVRGLSREYEFDIVTSTEKEEYFDAEFKRYGGKIFRCPKVRTRFGPLNRVAELLRPFRLFFFTKSLIRSQGGYRVIHCNNDFDMAGCAAGAKAADVPVRVCHTHRTWVPDSQFGVLTRVYRRLCRRTILRCATALVGCSPVANASLYGENAKTRVIWNAYDNSRFFWRCGDENAPPLSIAQVGNLTENKNQLFSLDVLKRLLDSRPDATITFVGGDPAGYKALMQKKITALGLENAVSFLPPDADIPELFSKCSVLLFPSRAEGFGIVLIEAQAMGLRCYASSAVPRETNVGGVQYLALSDGPDFWAEAVLSAADQPKAPYDCSKFSLESFLNAIREIYE